MNFFTAFYYINGILEIRTALEQPLSVVNFHHRKKKSGWRLEGFVNPIFIEDARF
jgi:hypothetical protein